MTEPPGGSEKPGNTFDSPMSEVARAETERTSDDPNVACVGFGLKIVDGKPTLRAALQYHVFRKCESDDEMADVGTQRVPAVVGGYDTDVLVWTVFGATACPGSKSPTGGRGGDKEDPLVGGTSTTVLGDFHSFPTGYGTLGGLCFDTTTGDAMALSNAHVYGFDTGNDAIQPWLPGSEYLEATLKYLTCGGPLAHLLFWTAPSPLTSILTTAAAAAWTAAALSDAEDPSRWGQRVGAVPPAGTRTEREVIRLNVPEVPDMPFPGRAWKASAEWDYNRVTGVGTTQELTVDDRPNEHVLVGKRVFTDRTEYRPGSRVTICAQLLTPVDRKTSERFVVAHSFPTSDPSRIVKRVLVPDRGTCLKLDSRVERTNPQVCVRGFEAQVPGVPHVSFPVLAAPFVVLSGAGTTQLLPASHPDNVAGVDALQIPARDSLRLACPSSTHVSLEVFHRNDAITARAFSANGTQADQSSSTGDQGAVQTIELSGPEIVRVEIWGAQGEGHLSAICADKWPLRDSHREWRSRFYTGTFDLSPGEPTGTWAVVVVSQTLDETPTGGDPIDAARRLGGIVDSANVSTPRDCACAVLFDHTFRVVDPGPLL